MPLDFKHGYCYDGGNTSPVEERRIPTLEEVFQHFPETAVNIDIKDHDPELVQKVSDLIDRYDRHHLTVWGNFRHNTTQLCGQSNPKVGLLFSFKRVLQVLVLYYTGLLPFVPIRETHFEIPMPTTWLSNDRQMLASFLDRVLMRKKLMKHLEARGIQTYMWVLNREEEFKKAFQCGVTGVMTDYPSLLAKYLESRPQYKRSTAQ